jgi:hypothetical protein
MKTKKKKRARKRPVNSDIFVSPDGGETVYVQKPDGTRGRLVSQTQEAKDDDQALNDQDLVGVEAIKLRRRYPSLKKAWDQYRVIWRLVNDND